MAGASNFDGDGATFLISVAAELAGMHAQTLRTYDRLGLVTPQRTSGGGRRYSSRDVELLREIQRLSQEEGVNLAGIKRIIDLSNQVEALQHRVRELTDEVLAQGVDRMVRVALDADDADDAVERGGVAGEEVVWGHRVHLGT